MNTLVVLLMSLALPLPVSAQDWKLDAGKSQVHFVIKQMNVPSEGGFHRFTAQAGMLQQLPVIATLRIVRVNGCSVLGFPARTFQASVARHSRRHIRRGA